MKTTGKITLLAIVLIVIGIAGASLTYKKVDKEPFNMTETAGADFTSLNVSASNAKITILKSDDDKAEANLSGDKHINRKIKFKSKVANGTWTVSANENRPFSFSFSLFMSPRKLTIRLPEKEYDKLQALTDNGRIAISDMNSKTIKLVTDNGRVDIKDSTASSIVTYTSNGRINFDNAKGKIKARTDNGRIDFAGKTIEDPLNFKTDNGRIQIKLDEKPKQVQLDAKTDLGRIVIFGQQSKNDIHIQGDGPAVKLRTDNGRIEVNALDD